MVRALSHKLMVMKRGDVVEAGPAEEMFRAPKTDYTRELMAAAFLKPEVDQPPIRDVAKT